MAMASSDLIVIVLRLPDRAILMVLVYMPGDDAEALLETIRLFRRTINDVRNKIRTQTDIVLVGDFNRHDYL